MVEKKNKTLKYLIRVAVVLVIVTLLLAGLYIWQITPRPYSAVVLATGDVYFGQVSYFPKMTLLDPYTIQAVEDPETPGQPSLQLLPLSEVSIWMPKKLVLNRDQVVSVSRVGEDSQVMQLIRSRSAAQ